MTLPTRWYTTVSRLGEDNPQLANLFEILEKIIQTNYLLANPETTQALNELDRVQYKRDTLNERES